MAHGGPVDTETPTPARKKSLKKAKSQPKEDELVHDLATLTQQHGATARKFVEKSAERARLMTFVPEAQWWDVVWFDEEDV